MMDKTQAKKTLAIVGFGDLGERLAIRLARAHWHCIGLRRRAGDVPTSVEGIAVDFARPETLRVLGERKPDALMIALSPAERTEAGYRKGFFDAMCATLDGLCGHEPKLAMFVSSTRVYACDDGGWVDEGSALAEDDGHARWIIAAEQAFLSALPGARVLRAAGLYAPRRPQVDAALTNPENSSLLASPLLARIAAGRLSPAKPLRYANRVHRDDVAGFMAFLLDSSGIECATTDAEVHRVINLVDDAPVPMQEIESWLCEKLHRQCVRPEAQDAERPRHKRISNARLHASGYTLLYPDYRAGYAPIFDR